MEDTTSYLLKEICELEVQTVCSVDTSTNNSTPLDDTHTGLTFTSTVLI